MFIHIFGFRWKPQATEADKARAAQDIVAFRTTWSDSSMCTSGRISPRAGRAIPSQGS